jgi:hypothetical protein
MTDYRNLRANARLDERVDERAERGPRKIKRHGFMPSPSNTQWLPMNCYTCHLPYESEVHWVLDEVVTPLEEAKKEDIDQTEGWEHGSLGASNEFGQDWVPKEGKVEILVELWNAAHNVAEKLVPGHMPPNWQDIRELEIALEKSKNVVIK